MTFTDKKNIERTSRIFFFGTILSRVSGLLRDILTAYAFGSSASIAALMVAFRFSSLLRRLFGEGALHAAFVPAFEKIRATSKKKAALFFVQLMVLLTIFLGLLIVFLELGLGGLLSFVKWSENARLIVNLTLILLPTLFFICSSALCSSLLQCQNIYFLPAVSPAVLNLFWIMGAFFLQNSNPNQAVYQLAIWILMGVIAQWLLLWPSILPYIKEEISSNLFKNFKLFKESLSQIAKPLGLGIIGVAATQINSAVDSLFARYTSLEGPAYLWYAIRIQQVPLALFGVAMAGAVLPPLARAYNRSKNEFIEIFNYSLSRAMGLLTPCFIALMILGPACINLLYGRGHFNVSAACQTSYCLWAYSFGLLPQGLILILAPAFYVQNQYFRTTRASFMALFLNVTLNAFFAFALKMPAWGVAFATAISSWFQIFYLAYFIGKDISLKKFRNFYKVSAQVLSIAFFSGLCTYFITVEYNFWLPAKTLLYFPRSLSMQVIIFLFQTLTYLFFLFVTAFLLKQDEILALLKHLPFIKGRR